MIVEHHSYQQGNNVMHQVIHINTDDTKHQNSIKQVRSQLIGKISQVLNSAYILFNSPYDSLKPIKLNPHFIPVHLIELYVTFKLIVLCVTCVISLVCACLRVLKRQFIGGVFCFDVNVVDLCFSLRFLIVQGVINVLHWNGKVLNILLKVGKDSILLNLSAEEL